MVQDKDIEDRLIRAKVQLQKEKPFWAFLISHLNMKETEQIETAGVDKSGNMFYNPKFFKTLTDEQIKFVLAHEVSHLALSHIFRLGNRDKNIWNVAGDIVINNVLQQDGFTMVEGCLNPKNDSIDLKDVGVKIDKISKKPSEEIYEKILQQNPNLKTKMITIEIGNGQQQQNGKDEVGGFDVHIYEGDGKDKKDGKCGKGKEIPQKEWTKRMVEAVQYAKQQGNLPLGIDRLVGDLINSRVNWRRMLMKYVTNQIPYDFTYSRPSKKSRALGIYLPSVKKESIEIVVAIDTSGSIGQEELTQFTSEIVSISKVVNNLKMIVYQIDAEIQDKLEVKNGNLKKILNMKMKGGGGTDFIPVFDKMKADHKNMKLLIYFTDGYGDFPKQKRFNFDTLWCLTKDSIDKESVPFGKALKLE